MPDPGRRSGKPGRKAGTVVGGSVRPGQPDETPALSGADPAVGIRDSEMGRGDHTTPTGPRAGRELGSGGRRLGGTARQGLGLRASQGTGEPAHQRTAGGDPASDRRTPGPTYGKRPRRLGIHRGTGQPDPQRKPEPAHRVEGRDRWHRSAWLTLPRSPAHGQHARRANLRQHQRPHGQNGPGQRTRRVDLPTRIPATRSGYRRQTERANRRELREMAVIAQDQKIVHRVLRDGNLVGFCVNQ
jgi:hypothetical protein